MHRVLSTVRYVKVLCNQVQIVTCQDMAVMWQLVIRKLCDML